MIKRLHILLVEDNEGDILLITDALQESKIVSQVSVVRDGEEALDYFNRHGKYCKAEMPDLVLLDVNLPKKNGHEVLHYVKSSEVLQHIPVIMLTTSSSESDISLSYKGHANCYITKPAELDELMNVVTQIENFWTNIVTLAS